MDAVANPARAVSESEQSMLALSAQHSARPREARRLNEQVCGVAAGRVRLASDLSSEGKLRTVDDVGSSGGWVGLGLRGGRCMWSGGCTAGGRRAARGCWAHRSSPPTMSLIVCDPSLCVVLQPGEDACRLLFQFAAVTRGGAMVAGQRLSRLPWTSRPDEEVERERGEGVAER